MTTADAPSDVVWICAHVEEMRETTAYMSVPRVEWDAMTVEQRDAFVDDFGAETMNSAGGYGADVVDESDVPADMIKQTR